MPKSALAYLQHHLKRPFLAKETEGHIRTCALPKSRCQKIVCSCSSSRRAHPCAQVDNRRGVGEAVAGLPSLLTVPDLHARQASSFHDPERQFRDGQIRATPVQKARVHFASTW